MSTLVKILGKRETTALLALVVVALVVLAALHIDVPASLEYLVTALIAGNLYGATPPHLQDATENGDAEGSA